MLSQQQDLLQNVVEDNGDQTDLNKPESSTVRSGGADFETPNLDEVPNEKLKGKLDENEET